MDARKLVMCYLMAVSAFCMLAPALCDKNYYELLGVNRDASDRDIKKAFRKMAIKYHPDKNPDPEARKMFEKIANAYDVLSDVDKRRHYDRFGEDPGQSGGGGGGGGTYHDNGFYDAFFSQGGNAGNFKFNFNFDDIFKDAFGDGVDGGPFGGFFHDFHSHSQQEESSFFNFNTNDGDGNKEDMGMFGDGFAGFGDFFDDMKFEAHASAGGHGCKTVTKKVGNTVSTYTTCS